MSRTVRLAAAALGAVVTFAVPAPGHLIGAAAAPWTGARGITRTVGQLMAHRRAPAATLIARHAPQTVPLSFLGGTLGDSGLVPADSMGAAGQSQFVVGINGLIRTFRLDGTADGVLDTSMDRFFAPVAGSDVTTAPRVRYDRLVGRWFITATSAASRDPGAIQLVNKVLLAVSDDSTITSATAFTYFAFQQDAVTPVGDDAGCFLSTGTLAVDANALYVGGDFFCTHGTTQDYVDSGAFVIRKSSVLDAGPIVVTAFRALASGTVRGPFAPQGADNDDRLATTGYLIGADRAVSQLELVRVDDPGGTPSISATIDIPVASTAPPGPVPHRGGANGPLAADDGRLGNAAIRDGQVWTAQTIRADSTGMGTASGDRDAVRWYQIGNLDGAPSVTQFGTVFDAAASGPDSYFVPSINASRQGHVALGGTVAGVSSFLSAWTAGRLAGDAPGATGAPLRYALGAGAYNPSPPGSPDLWGPYSFTSVDPNDGMTMWTIHAYADAADSWGVSVAMLAAPPPVTPASAVPASIPVGQPSVSVTVTGTQVAGSGFFDPGTDFASHLFAFVNGGITVNSVRYVSPTSVVLDLDTAGAAVGLHSVTITNPDGQSATGVGLLTTTR